MSRADLPSLRQCFSMKWLSNSGMSSGRCRSGGIVIGKTFKRYQVLMIGGARVVPRYGAITVARADQVVESPLNEEGRFFLDLPNDRHKGTVSFKGKSCEIEFDAATGDDLIQNLGTLTCTP